MFRGNKKRKSCIQQIKNYGSFYVAPITEKDGKEMTCIRKEDGKPELFDGQPEFYPLNLERNENSVPVPKKAVYWERLIHFNLYGQ